MPKSKNKKVEEKIAEIEELDLDKIELKVEKVPEEKQSKKTTKEEKKKKTKTDDPKEDQLTPEQREIIRLKSQLMQEKVKNVGKKKQKNFITKKQKRTFSDTSYDDNATTKSILKGAGFMVFAFGLLSLIIWIFLH